MTTIDLDQSNGYELTETSGVVAAVTRPVLLRGIVGPLPAGKSVADVSIADPLLPQPGAQHPWYAGLYVESRRFEAWGIENGLFWARWLIDYARVSRTIDPAEHQLSGSVTLESLRTVRDAAGAKIVIGPEGEQGGEIDVLAPRSTLRIQAPFVGADPEAYAQGWVGFVNLTTWMGSPAQTWLVTSCTYEFVGWTALAGGAVNRRWDMVFELTRNPQGWQPRVEWINPGTGRPSPLTSALYTKVVNWYPTREFDQFFPA